MNEQHEVHWAKSFAYLTNESESVSCVTKLNKCVPCMSSTWTRKQWRVEPYNEEEGQAGDHFPFLLQSELEII
jgi:hypothetical protein